MIAWVRSGPPRLTVASLPTALSGRRPREAGFLPTNQELGPGLDVAAALHFVAAMQRWGLILAGGEGVRLRPLTRAIAGQDCPKQFCAVIGLETPLERTRRRAALTIAPARTLVALTRRHERFYEPLLRGMPPHCALVQPQDRGTTPAILYGLRRIAAVAPTASVAIMPSDHYVADDAIFMSHVTAAFDAVQAGPELVVLLGIEPESAETEYGWIEPAAAIPGTGLFRVSRFREKPEPAVAEALFARRCLWNSFVMVAAVPALLGLIRLGAAALDSAFAGVLPALGTSTESSAIRDLYERLPASSFSADVLASRPANLAVLPVRGVQWSDWGHPTRVLSTLARLGVRPEWADRVAMSDSVA
jgi:mannose-1-phosphate guanylyltransferase